MKLAPGPRAVACTCRTVCSPLSCRPSTVIVLPSSSGSVTAMAAQPRLPLARRSPVAGQHA
jgi:hypothetical protein